MQVISLFVLQWDYNGMIHMAEIPAIYIKSRIGRVNVKYLFHFFAITKQFSNLWHSTRLVPAQGA